MNIDTYEATPTQLSAAAIERLPSTLGEAVAEFARGDFAREVLGTRCISRSPASSGPSG
jgi:glutamine synthetase